MQRQNPTNTQGIITPMNRIPLHGLRTDGSKSLTVRPLQRTLCGRTRLHSMQESPGSNRETIETHLSLLRFLTWYEITYATYRRKASKEANMQQHNINKTQRIIAAMTWINLSINSLSVHGDSSQVLCLLFLLLLLLNANTDYRLFNNTKRRVPIFCFPSQKLNCLIYT